jgi:hypothetical protein
VDNQTISNFQNKQLKYHFRSRDFGRLETSLKIVSPIETESKIYDLMIKYLKFRSFISKSVEKREIKTKFTEGDLSNLLFNLEDQSVSKKMNFASMIFTKEISKNQEISKNCELKGKN